jgi:hypothetical protein
MTQNSTTNKVQTTRQPSVTTFLDSDGIYKLMGTCLILLLDASLGELKSFILSERQFVKNLGCVMNVYYPNIWTDPTLFAEIDKADVVAIFSNFESIFNFHTSFLERLELVAKNWPQKQLISIWTDWVRNTRVNFLFNL